MFSFCVESQASQECRQVGREESHPEINKTVDRLGMKKMMAARRPNERRKL